MTVPAGPGEPAGRAHRLDLGVVPVIVLLSAIACTGGGVYWWRDRESKRDTAALEVTYQERMAVVAKIAEVERVFTERANQQSAAAAREGDAVRLALERTEGRILAAIEAAAQRTATLEREVKSWVALFDAQNRSLTVPAFGK